MKRNLRYLALVLLLTSVTVGIAYASYGYCDVYSSGSQNYARGITSTSQDFQYLHVYLYVENEIVADGHDQWNVHPSFNICDTTPLVTISSGEEYYAYSAHGCGPVYAVCDEEWTYQTGTYTKNKSVESLEVVGSEIAKYFNLPTKDLTPGNLLSPYTKGTVMFNNSLDVRIGAFHSLMDIGDYAPSYWLDSKAQKVYVGTKSRDGKYLLYESQWTILKDCVEWSDFKAVK